jgi:uncharacterized protein YbbK (DUF523 family)
MERDKVERILISACLIGQKVRYDGQDKATPNNLIQQWQDEGRLVPICPEVAAGLSIPRRPAEIVTVNDMVRVQEDTGGDVTDAFERGAQLALDKALQHECRFAILTDGSPSCGSQFIYDGSFSGQQIEGQGLTTQLLESAGIRVFTHSDLKALEAVLAET